jgi:hypothetical protein
MPFSAMGIGTECFRRKLSMKPASSSAVTSVSIEVAPGDLLDRVSILEIKTARITSESALRSVRVELASLRAARDGRIVSTAELEQLTAELRHVNEKLWELEDAVRASEAAKDFGPKFIASARAIIHTNNRRAALKQAINRMLGANFQDEKSFPLPDPDLAELANSLSVLGETKRQR